MGRGMTVIREEFGVTKNTDLTSGSRPPESAPRVGVIEKTIRYESDVRRGTGHEFYVRGEDAKGTVSP